MIGDARHGRVEQPLACRWLCAAHMGLVWSHMGLVWRMLGLAFALTARDPSWPALHGTRRLGTGSNGLELGGDGGAEEDGDGREEGPELKRYDARQRPVDVAK